MGIINIEFGVDWFTLTVFFVYGLAFWLTNCILFTKAKQPGWAAITPIYGFLIYAKIAKTNRYSAALAGLIYAFSHLPYIVTLRSAAGDDFFELILFISLLVGLIISLHMFNKFYQKFRINGWFWFAYVFFPPLALPFAKNAYYISATELQ